MLDELERITRLLSTSSGTDKCLMLIQYVALLLSKISARGHKFSSSRRLSQRFGALSGLVSETRTTIRLLDLFSLLQWWRSLKPSGHSFKSRILDLERMEVISMLVFYPLEHIYFLTTKKILPCSPRVALKAALYSCRAWAVYTFLHLGRLWHSYQELQQEQIQQEQQGSEKQAKIKFEARRAALINGLTVNLAYLPLTLHWSLEKGLYSSEYITAFCGLFAAVTQLRVAWKAS
ncbi:hypothetical protein CROQUDRAFT_668604 [Cronartium quercuum f. sp. fusiforme G11]|uniref:Peroxisomal membrane protein 11C n=1 Tax=Cronartium quercuum f. sp. fusiforme G11 TaxID=708437 RepID=A0A9P6NN96_9BASI|nr:hypothetical protein CROQUDRAFT_668604 [Cronartium quercuum f. sp. fusiforme G11]